MNINQLMKESAFKSNFTLSFKNSNIEKFYKKTLEPRIKIFNKIISFLLFATTLLSLMLIIEKRNLESRFDPLIVIVPNAIVAFLFFLSFIITLFIKNMKFHDYMKYFIYIMMTFTFIFLRYYTRALAGVDMIAYTTVMNVEFIMRIFFVIIGIFSFLETLIMSILVIITFFTYNFPVFGVTYLSSIHVAYYTLIITVILISYYYVAEKRSSFFYNHKLENNNNWYNDVIDNMNNGFICLQNKSLKFMNKTLLNLYKRKLSLCKPYENVEKIEINYNQNVILHTEMQSNLNLNNNYMVCCNTERRNSSNYVLSNENNNFNYKTLPSKIESIRDKNLLVTDICEENTNEIINYLFNDENFDLINNHENPKANEDEKLKVNCIKEINLTNLNQINNPKNLKTENFSMADFLFKLKQKYLNTKINEKFDENDGIKHNYPIQDSNNKINNFVLLGNKKFEFKEDDEEIEKIFEISFRYYTNAENQTLEVNDFDHFEFIFNDVTRTKIMEEKNAEFKYKSLFLSKIAHEFKNPLICITELVDQTCDMYNCDSSNYFMVNHSKISIKQLKTIKSLSDYLLILIKDLDYFSQRQLENKIEIVPSEVNLSDMLSFTKNVGKSLLTKNGKSNNVKIIIEKSKDVPRRINIDEIRLKQILINLLSNAIKFTSRGYIKISVTREESRIKFLVSDSGIGMTNIQMENLFKPFKKGKDLTNANRYGSGLGLSIVYEMTQKIGSQIEYYSREGEGTKFWFYIPITFSSLFSGVKKMSKKKSKSSFMSFSNHQELKRVKSTILADNHNSLEKIRSNSIDKLKNKNSSKLINKIFDNFQLNIEYSQNINESDYIIRISPPHSDSYNESEVSSSDECSQSNYSVDTQIVNSINLDKPPLVMAKEAIARNNILSQINLKKEGVPHETKNSNRNKLSLPSIEINKDVGAKRVKSDSIFIKNRSATNSKINLNNIMFNNNTLEKSDLYTYLNLDADARNVLIIDDEKLTRQSTMRMLKKICAQKEIKINLIEGEDGIECVYLFYKLIKDGIKISGIISDETMNYVKGSKTAQIIGEIQEKKGITKIPYFILTAYEDKYTLKNLMNKYINDIFTKPLMNFNAERFLNSLLVN
jgi:signal transduction histidine kinase